MKQNKSVTYDPKIILVDDEKMCLQSMDMTLRSAGYSSIINCQDGTKVPDLIEQNGCDLLVLDILMPCIHGTKLFKQIKHKHPEIEIIMVTGVDDINVAVNVMKEGVRDYILKPIERERFLSAINYALELKALVKENQALSESLLSSELKNAQIFENIITCSEKMYSIFRYIEAVAPTHNSVLITGETGTGKELIAKAIHDSSKRTGEFIAVNVAGLDDSMFTDTLFGHIKGSFTGADGVRKGLVERAGEGTLFLDEIGDLSDKSQIKLLRLLQEKEYFPLGSDIAKRSKTRIIAATCKDLYTLKEKGLFRNDLFYRLKTHYINLPPLRDRKEDIKILANYFIEHISKELNKNINDISSEIGNLLEKYLFPGNIRELESFVYDACSRASSTNLRVLDFGEIAIKSEFKNLNKQQITQEKSGSSSVISFPENLPTIKQCSDLLVKEAMKRAKGKLSPAASMLGITRQALGQRLQKNKN